MVLESTTGGDGDVLVLVHGWGTSGALFDRVVQRLAPRLRIVRVDLAGYGASPRPPGPRRIADHAEDLRDTLVELGLQRPAIAGHSMGGLVVADLAARHPDEVGPVALLESPLVPPPALRQGTLPVLEGLRGDGWRTVPAGFLRAVSGAHVDPADLNLLIDGMAACTQEVLVSDLEAVLAFDGPAAAEGLTGAVLYVGTEVSHYVDLDALRARCPQVRVALLIGCGHYFPLEVPDQLAPVLRRFLQTAGAP